MYTLAWPWMLALLPVPVAVYLLAPPWRSGQAALRTPFYQGVSQLAGDAAPSLNRSRLALAALIWVLLVVAAARPQWIGEPDSIPVTGRDVMLAVDVSESMKAEDMQLEGQLVDRLTAVKAVAGEFMARRTGDRVGLVLFGSRAYLQTPLSFDLATVDELLNEAAIGIAGRKTAIGDAVGLALKHIGGLDGDFDTSPPPGDPPDDDADEASATDDAPATDDDAIAGGILYDAGEKVLILLTDGANTAGEIDPIRAARLGQTAGLRIYTIGVGADEMMQQTLFGNRRVNPSSDLDEDTLREMAEITGGRYFRARDGESLEEIYLLIDELEPIAEESRYLPRAHELYYLPLLLAVLLALGRGLYACRGYWRGAFTSAAPAVSSTSSTRRPWNISAS